VSWDPVGHLDARELLMWKIECLAARHRGEATPPRPTPAEGAA
jgi:hypothetical protein